jgi:hypothetical protein
VRAREGSVLNCVAPAAVNARLSTCQRVVDLIHGALAQAVPERLTAAHNGACFVASFVGRQPATGAPWVYLETIGGGFGARATKDGLDGTAFPLVGRVSMDLTTFDISDLPEGAVVPGGFVALIDAANDADAVALRANTIGYEILTGLSRRAHRIWLGA